MAHSYIAKEKTNRLWYYYDANLEGNKPIFQDCTSLQAKDLEKDGWKYNEKQKTYDLFETQQSIFFDITYLLKKEIESPLYQYIQREKYDIEYKRITSEEVSVDSYILQHNLNVKYREGIKNTVPVHKYIIQDNVEVVYRAQELKDVATYEYARIYEDPNFYDVAYIETDQGFFTNFFRKVTKKITQRVGVSERELKQLQHSNTKGEISSLTFFQNPKEMREDLKLTQKEAQEYLDDGEYIKKMGKKSVGHKKETTDVIKTDIITTTELPRFIRNKEIINTSSQKETVDLTEKEYKEQYQNQGKSLQIQKFQVSEREEIEYREGNKYLADDDYADFIQGKELIEKTDEIIPVELTQNEYINSYVKKGQNLKAHKKGVGKKLEYKEEKGSAVIEKKDYEKFMKDKTEVSKKIEKTFVELTKKEYEELYESRGIYFELENHKPVGTKKETIEEEFTERVSEEEAEAFRKGKTIISEEEIIEKEETLVNQTKIKKFSLYIYYPTAWSELTGAKYVCAINIDYYNYFDPRDERYFKEEEIILKMRDIVNQLPMEFNIDKAGKWQDGTNGLDPNSINERIEFTTNYPKK